MDTAIAIALSVLVSAGMLAYVLWDPTRFRKPAEPPKIRLGDHVTIMYGDVPISHMILVEINSTFNGENEARLIDVATYEARHRVD